MKNSPARLTLATVLPFARAAFRTRGAKTRAAGRQRSLSAVPSNGCSDYIPKPISLDRLLALLDTIYGTSLRPMNAAPAAP
jgi:hypothetical protein